MQTLTTELKYVKTQNGNLAAQTDVLLLRTSELKSLFPKEAKAIKDMGVKVSKATQVSNTVIETQKNIITPILSATTKTIFTVLAPILAAKNSYPLESFHLK